MGIPAYFSTIIKRYPTIIKKYKTATVVNQLFVDCNSIIYDSFNKLSVSHDLYSHTTFENELINDVIEQLDYYVKTIGGTDLNYLAFDGVAPVAKMEQQRTRRYKSKYEKELFMDVDKSSIQPWNTSAITPGTLFMKHLERCLIFHYKKTSNIVIAFSDEGEGEHKIFDWIRINSIDKKIPGKTIIYGLDSDLIMLSLQNLNCCDELYLYREMPDFIESIDKNLQANEIYMVDIMDFKKYLSYYLNNDVIPKSSEQSESRIKDYIFICFLLGNDFLPHFPAINLRRNGMDLLMESYVTAIGKTKEYIIVDDKINWKVFRNMVIEMSTVEQDYLKDEFNYRNKQEKYHVPNNTLEEKKQYFRR